jgi:CBS domain-containing protein
MHVQAILARKGDQVATIRPGATLAEAVEALRRHGVGALVVSSDGARIEGILSERDVVRRLAAEGAAALEGTVARAMTVDVTTCVGDDDVEQLMHTMTDRRIRHLPVLSPDGSLGGIVSIGDVVKSRLNKLESENQALFDYLTNTR